MPNERIAFVPGSFDPITIGHIDIIKRSAKLFDKVYVVVAVNESKSYMFDTEKRVEIAKAALCNIPNVYVISTDGIVVLLAEEMGAEALVKGIRNGEDLAYENYIAKVNREYSGKVETVYLPCTEGLDGISSTFVRGLISEGLPISDYVGKSAEAVISKFTK